MCVSFPLLLYALVFTGLLEAVGDDRVGETLLPAAFWFSFPSFSWSADFLLSPCQPTAAHHQRSCDSVHWILEVQTLHCWVLLGAGHCWARSDLMENSWWVWKWIWVFGEVAWPTLDGMELFWHWNSLHNSSFSDFPAQELIFGYFHVS